MAVAASTVDLHARHAVALVGMLSDILGGDRLKETGPTGARVEFCIRRKQRQAAAGTRVDPQLFVIEERAAKRPLGAATAEYAELLRRQTATPLVVT